MWKMRIPSKIPSFNPKYAFFVSSGRKFITDLAIDSYECQPLELSITCKPSSIQTISGLPICKSKKWLKELMFTRGYMAKKRWFPEKRPSLYWRAFWRFGFHRIAWVLGLWKNTFWAIKKFYPCSAIRFIFYFVIWLVQSFCVAVRFLERTGRKRSQPRRGH